MGWIKVIFVKKLYNIGLVKQSVGGGRPRVGWRHIHENNMAVLNTLVWFF